MGLRHLGAMWRVLARRLAMLVCRKAKEEQPAQKVVENRESVLIAPLAKVCMLAGARLRER